MSGSKKHIVLRILLCLGAAITIAIDTLSTGVRKKVEC